MENVVVVHNGTIQKMNRKKAITGAKLNLVNSSDGDTSGPTIPNPDHALHPPRNHLSATVRPTY